MRTRNDACATSSESPAQVTVAGMKFIGGLPTTVATKRLAGWW